MDKLCERGDSWQLDDELPPFIHGPTNIRVSISLESFASPVYLRNSYTWETAMEHGLLWLTLAVACGVLAGLLLDQWLGVRGK